MTAKELYRSLTPYRSTHKSYKRDLGDIRSSRDPLEKAQELGKARKLEKLRDELWAHYSSRGLNRPIDQNDVFMVRDMLDYELDPATQWPILVDMLRKAKDRQLSYDEYEESALIILQQYQVLPDFWWCRSANRKIK